MATMIAYTAIDLPAEQKRALCVGVELSLIHISEPTRPY